ncbi:MAG: hypothetical protein V2A69_03910 [Pseudomonadota bacterium]
MLTPEEEKKKREIFEAMSPKRQERVLKKGYDNWDPFQRPKEPFEQVKRAGGTIERALTLSHRYFEEKKITNYSTAYFQGVMDVCQGIVRDDDRYRGMYDFCCWYRDKKEEGNS